jgi:hypothetical protein
LVLTPLERHDSDKVEGFRMVGLDGKDLQIESLRFGESPVLVVLERKFESLLKCHPGYDRAVDLEIQDGNQENMPNHLSTIQRQIGRSPSQLPKVPTPSFSAA